MNVRYTPRAARHIRSIADFAARNPTASRRVGLRMHEAVQLLARFPELGHEGALAGTREFVVPGFPYIIVHRLDRDGAVTILGVYHGAQLRPGLTAPTDDVE